MKVRELLSSPDKWTQDFGARGADGLSIEWDSPEATCWCLIGAIVKCYPTRFEQVRDRIKKHLGVQFLSAWNDRIERTFEDVKALVTELDI